MRRAARAFPSGRRGSRGSRARRACASRALRACALLALALAGAASPALAHGRSTSTSAWEVHPAGPGERPWAEVRVQVTWLDLARALPSLAGLEPGSLAFRPELAAAVEDYLTSHYQLRAAGEPCPARGVAPAPTPDPGQVARRWRATCATGGALSIRADGFLEVAPSHLHLARIRRGDAPPVERVFVLGSTHLALDEGAGAAPAASSLGAFVRLGIDHIVTGYDHLAFLLALLLVGVSVAEVATVVTGFTVAHSVTLALGVLGVVRPDRATVEALIGLSIAVVALENAALTVTPRGRRAVLGVLAALLAGSTAAAAAGWMALPASALAGVGLFSLCYFGLLPRVERPGRMRWLLAFVFGLVHGFGFAGILAEMDLPRANLAAALFGFNAGVEVGQLGLVALSWPLLRLLLAGPPPRRRAVVQAGSAAILAAGLFWFTSRAV